MSLAVFPCAALLSSRKRDSEHSTCTLHVVMLCSTSKHCLKHLDSDLLQTNILLYISRFLNLQKHSLTVEKKDFSYLPIIILQHLSIKLVYLCILLLDCLI